MRLGRPGFGFLVLSLVSVLGVAPLARAQDGPPAAREQPSANTLVVIADTSSDATQNSELRAALYDVGRSLGYEAGGSLDIDGVATRESVMRNGVITTDASELERLRKALGVAAVARVSKSAEQGSARLTLATAEGVVARNVSGAGLAVDPLKKALGELLLPVGKPKSDVATLPPSGGGASLVNETPPEKSPSNREAWEARSGVRLMYGAMAEVTGVELRDVAFSATTAQGAPIGASGTSAGVGGGVGVRVGLMYMTLADPTVSTGSFFVFRLDAGLDTNVFWARKPAGYTYPIGGRDTSYQNQALWVVTAPLEGGFALGVGSFGDRTTWRGVILGAAYAPAPEFTMDLAKTSGQFRFNPAGAEITADITHLSAESVDSEMQIRVSLWGLLPLDDDRPGLLSLGIGAIWY